MKPPNSRFNQTHCLRTAIFFISDTSISLPDGQGYETQPCNKQQKQFTHNNQGTKVQIAIISHEIITLVLEESGHLSCLKWARENGCPWNELTCKSAASGGHLSCCLQWARENGCPWDIDTYRKAQSCGNSEVLKYVIYQGCPTE